MRKSRQMRFILLALPVDIAAIGWEVNACFVNEKYDILMQGGYNL